MDLAKKKKYYAVNRGRVRGIYTEWFGDRGAEKQVRGYPGAWSDWGNALDTPIVAGDKPV